MGRSACQYWQGRGIEIDPIQGGQLDAETLKRVLDSVDTVFHLGGRASFESYRRLRPTIVEGTAELGRLAAAAGVEHFVFASSRFVYRDRDALCQMRGKRAFGGWCCRLLQSSRDWLCCRGRRVDIDSKREEDA